jgi:hypothetical protein
VTNQNSIHEETKDRLNVMHACMQFRILCLCISYLVIIMVILPVDVYGCETWFVTFKEEHRGCLRTGCL